MENGDDGGIELVVCHSLLAKLTGVLERPGFREYIRVKDDRDFSTDGSWGWGLVSSLPSLAPPAPVLSRGKVMWRSVFGSPVDEADLVGVDDRLDAVA